MRRRSLLSIAFVVFSLAAFAQVNCVYVPTGTVVGTLNGTLVRSEGKAELVSDALLTCTSTANQSLLVTIDLFLNVNATSRITGPGQLTDTLLLIDEPQPGVANLSNGFPYFGQVLGTPGILAGNPGSGNVYQGTLVNDNQIEWNQVPFVANGTRTLRITNIRADANVIGPGNPINADIIISSPLSFSLNPSSITALATVKDGLKFSTSAPNLPGVLTLDFEEKFNSAFKKRIENTTGGPLTARRQDVPGAIYCTESGFTPEFSSVAPNAIGSATTGTRLLANFENLPPSVFVLIVPNQVPSSSGKLVAHRVIPPIAADFTGGSVLVFPGFGLVPVSANHTAEILYEVTAAVPFSGINGCAQLDGFKVNVFSVFPTSLQSAKVTGHFAPDDPTQKASPTAPTPRFVP